MYPPPAKIGIFTSVPPLPPNPPPPTKQQVCAGHEEKSGTCNYASPYQHGGGGGLEQAGHVLDGKNVDAQVVQLPRELQVVVQVVLLAVFP